jgi:N-acetylglucosaminyl-diphospho-decaprenol L-rhamnosyltransferase
MRYWAQYLVIISKNKPMSPEEDTLDIDVSILIVNYNTPELLPQLFASLALATKRISHEIIFLDNASKIDCQAQLATLAPNAVFIQNKVNVGFGRANNQALKLARGRYILLLNTDAFMSEDTLEKTIDFMRTTPSCGILGVKLIGRDGLLQPSCRYFPTPLNIFLLRTGLQRFVPWSKPVDNMNWDHASVRECDWVPGCYYLVRREVIEQVGLFDPIYFLYCEEVDHCKAAKKAGWKVVYFPFAFVVHLGGESAKSEGNLTASGQQLSALQLESELLYLRKHFSLLGVLSHLVLLSVADFYSVFASLIKRRDTSFFSSAIRSTLAAWKSFLLTKFARVASR